MTASQNRIMDMSKAGMSDMDISGLTGIPRSTIGFVRRGERQMSSEYLTPLRDQWRRFTYHSLRDEGHPYHQARRYGSASVKDANAAKVEMRMLVTQSTRGGLTAVRASLEKQGLLYDSAIESKSMLAKVKAGYRKSRKDFKQMKDYKFRKGMSTQELHEQQEAALKDLGW